MSNSFFQKDIVSVRDFDKQKFETVFDATDKIIKMSPNERREIARGKTLGYLFFEPSTRTRLSFEAASSAAHQNFNRRINGPYSPPPPAAARMVAT